MPAPQYGPLAIELDASPGDCYSPIESGWGGGKGSIEWGGGLEVAESMCLVRALAWRENVVRLYFSDSPLFRDLGEPGDASSLARYEIAEDSETIGIDELPARPVLPVLANPVTGRSRQIDLWVDRPFSPFPTEYIVTVNGLVTIGGLPLSGLNTSVRFQGLFKGLPKPVPELAHASRDIANPQSNSALYDPLPEAATLPDELLGTYRYDETGDLGLDEGLVSYKKRVFRRLTTRKGRFAHLRGYGTLALESVKRLARPAIRQSIAADAEEQIRQEPETEAVSVTVEVTQTGVAYYRIRVKTNIGAAGFDVPVLTEE